VRHRRNTRVVQTAGELPDRFSKCRSCLHVPGDARASSHGGKAMLETIAVVLVLLWLLGFVTSYTLGGFIHILLVLAVIVVLIRLIQGRRV